MTETKFNSPAHHAPVHTTLRSSAAASGRAASHYAASSRRDRRYARAIDGWLAGRIRAGARAARRENAAQA